MLKTLSLAALIVLLGFAVLQAQEIPLGYRLIALQSNGEVVYGPVELSLDFGPAIDSPIINTGTISGKALNGNTVRTITGTWHRGGDRGLIIFLEFASSDGSPYTDVARGILIPAPHINETRFTIRGHWLPGGGYAAPQLEGVFEAQSVSVPQD